MARRESNKQPTLKAALASALAGLKQGDLHTTQGESGQAILAECPHNAGRIFQCMQSMVLDAGYIPLGIMLGGIVRPVIDRSPIDGCQTCRNAFWKGTTLEARAFEWYRDGNEAFVVDVSRDLAEHDGPEGGHGCTGPDGDCQMFRALTVNGNVVNVSAGYLRADAIAINPLTEVDADVLDGFDYAAFEDAEKESHA